ncbi:MAG: DciA family protein [Bacteroidota bacterium]|nr:DciA family protein [Bacteroidota bacterium]
MAGVNKYYYLYQVRRGRAEANEMPLQEFLEVFFKRCHIDYSPYEEEIKKQWTKTTGKLIKHYTKSLYLNKKILYVTLTSPIAKAELSMVKEAVKNKINRDIGKEVLKDIVLIS